VKRGSPLSRIGEAAVGTACALLLLLAVVITGCDMSVHEASIRSANVVEAVGRTTIPVLDTCRVVLTRDAEAIKRVAETPDGQPLPLHMSPEQAKVVQDACAKAGDAYDAIQRTHEALLAAIDVTEKAEAAGLPSRWGDVAALVADALAATEKARQAIEAARVALRGRS
jgi:hypothetical protein